MYVSSFEIHARVLYDINIGLLQAPTSPLGSRRFVCQNPFHLASRYNRAATSPLGSPAASSLPPSPTHPFTGGRDSWTVSCLDLLPSLSLSSISACSGSGKLRPGERAAPTLIPLPPPSHPLLDLAGRSVSPLCKHAGNNISPLQASPISLLSFARSTQTTRKTHTLQSLVKFEIRLRFSGAVSRSSK